MIPKRMALSIVACVVISLNTSVGIAAKITAQDLRKMAALSSRFQSTYASLISIMSETETVDSISFGLLKNEISLEFAKSNGLKLLLEMKIKLNSIKADIEAFPSLKLFKPEISSRMEIWRRYLPLLHKEISKVVVTTKELLIAAIRGEVNVARRIEKKQMSQLIISLKSENEFSRESIRAGASMRNHPQRYLIKCIIAGNNAVIVLVEYRMKSLFDITSQDALRRNVISFANEIKSNARIGNTYTEILLQSISRSKTISDDYKQTLSKAMKTYRNSFKIELKMANSLEKFPTLFVSFLQKKEKTAGKIQNFLLTLQTHVAERMELVKERTRLIGSVKKLSK